ncbi:MAG: mechanosensitive ion channel family protein [Anaerolineales bacterium]
MDISILGNSLQQWLIALALGAATVVLLRAAQALIRRRLESLAGRTRTTMDDLAIDLVGRTKLLFLLLIGVFVGSLSLNLPDSWVATLGIAVIIGLWVQGGFWGGGLVHYFISSRLQQERSEDDAVGETTVSAMGAVANVLLWSVVILMALDNVPGVQITTLLASLGVGGIAVALALQNVLGDLFASLAIALDKPFVIGDFIIVGDYLGTIERIGLKTTRIRSLSGEQIVFSNSDLLNSRVRNFKVMFERRVVFEFGILYETPLEKIEKVGSIVQNIIESMDKTRFDRAHFKQFGDSALNYEVVYFVLDPEFNVYMDIQQAINIELFRRFRAEGIEFAYPTQTLYVTHGDEAQQPSPEKQSANGLVSR